MALTLTQVELSSAIRLGDSAEEVAESTRLLAFATEAISRHLGDAYEGAPEAVVNEAAIRLAGYLFDMPNAGRGLSFANAGRNSGAWTILLPYRIHRAGSTGEAVAAAQQAIGTPGNPVIDVTTDVAAGTLTVSFADGTSRAETLPGMTGDGADQTARDAADGAQGTADGATTAAAAAQSDIDAHEASPHNTDAGARTAAANAQSAIEDHERTTHNTDTTARDAAAAAQGTANNAATAATAAAATANANTGRLDAFPAGTGGVDQTARDAADGAQGTADGAQTAAAAAQGAIDAHEASPHNTDGTARTA